MLKAQADSLGGPEAARGTGLETHDFPYEGSSSTYAASDSGMLSPAPCHQGERVSQPNKWIIQDPAPTNSWEKYFSTVRFPHYDEVLDRVKYLIFKSRCAQTQTQTQIASSPASFDEPLVSSELDYTFELDGAEQIRDDDPEIARYFDDPVWPLTSTGAIEGYQRRLNRNPMLRFTAQYYHIFKEFGASKRSLDEGIPSPERKRRKTRVEEHSQDTVSLIPSLRSVTTGGQDHAHVRSSQGLFRRSAAEVGRDIRHRSRPSIYGRKQQGKKGLMIVKDYRSPASRAVEMALALKGIASPYDVIVEDEENASDSEHSKDVGMRDSPPTSPEDYDKHDELAGVSPASISHMNFHGAGSALRALSETWKPLYSHSSALPMVKPFPAGSPLISCKNAQMPQQQATSPVAIEPPPMAIPKQSSLVSLGDSPATDSPLHAGKSPQIPQPQSQEQRQKQQQQQQQQQQEKAKSFHIETLSEDISSTVDFPMSVADSPHKPQQLEFEAMSTTTPSPNTEDQVVQDQPENKIPRTRKSQKNPKTPRQGRKNKKSPLTPAPSKIAKPSARLTRSAAKAKLCTKFEKLDRTGKSAVDWAV